MILSQIGDDTPMAADLQEIHRAGVRAAALVQQLLTFGRGRMLQARRLDLNVVIEGLWPMLERLVGERMELRFDRSPDLTGVYGDPGQLEQVVMNLVLNARDAMPEGGTLTVETRNATVSERQSLEHVEAPAGQYAMMVVRDTGIGMDEVTRTRLFEPFFTTKPFGGGTGLGLSTVYGIVTQMNGFIWVHSEPGKGSAFTLYFPASPRDVEMPASPTNVRVTPGLGGRGTILLVEDEQAVRRIARVALERHGFRVIEATNAAEALGYGFGSEPIDLLLTDVVMPGLSGPELATRIAAVRPTLSIVYMSGYPEAIVNQPSRLASRVRLLAKPFTVDRLLTSVQEALQAQS